MHYMTSFLQSNAVLKLNSSVMITFQYSLQSPFVKLLFLLLKGKENESWSSFNDGTYELGNKWLFPRSFLLYMTWRTWVPGLLRSEQITVLRSDLYMCALHCEVVVAFFHVVAIPNHIRRLVKLTDLQSKICLSMIEIFSQPNWFFLSSLKNYGWHAS